MPDFFYFLCVDLLSREMSERSQISRGDCNFLYLLRKQEFRGLFSLTNSATDVTYI